MSMEQDMFAFDMLPCSHWGPILSSRISEYVTFQGGMHRNRNECDVLNC